MYTYVHKASLNTKHTICLACVRKKHANKEGVYSAEIGRWVHLVFVHERHLSERACPAALRDRSYLPGASKSRDAAIPMPPAPPPPAPLPRVRSGAAGEARGNSGLARSGSGIKSPRFQLI